MDFIIGGADRVQLADWLYTATLRIGNAEFSRPIRIEMIKPNRIEVNLELPEDELTGMEPLLEAPLSAAWLHGAPASELEADIGVMLTSRPTRFSEILRIII